MNISTAFPSKYITAADLNDRPHRVKINYVKMEDLGDDTKPALYLIGREKGIILNKTNANAIADLYGDDTDDWADQEVEIYPSETDYQGKRVPCIRVRAVSMKPQTKARADIVPNARQRAEQTRTAPRYDDRNPPPADEDGGPDDEIPF